MKNHACNGGSPPRRGSSALETVLLLATIGLPLMVLIFFGIRILAAHYGMVTTLNALPIG
jgi:hypothetical protein